MKMRRLIQAGTLACLWLVTPVRAGHLVNEGFEQSGGTDDSTTTFVGWNESGGGTHVVKAPAPLSGTASAQILNNTASGFMAQAVPYQVSQWSLDLDFAMPDPNGAGNRAFSLIIPNVAAGQINLRVVTGTVAGKGSVQAFSTVWNTILPNAVNLSADLSNPVTNHMRVDADWSSTNESARTYTVNVGGTATAPLSHYQNATPSRIRQLEFHGEFSQAPYVMDNVSFIPEPGGLALLGVVGSGLLVRHRRMASRRRG